MLVPMTDKLIFFQIIGTANRTVAATQMNATSSRAHTVVTIVFDQISKNATGQETKKSSNINLVDLAGLCTLLVYSLAYNSGVGMENIKNSALGLVVHTLRAYSSFHSIKLLGVFLLTPGWDSSSSKVYPPA